MLNYQEQSQTLWTFGAGHNCEGETMIQVTRLNGSKYYVNAELIYTLEATPDTIITLTDGSKMVVREAVSAVVESILDYQRKVRRPFDPEEAVK